MEFNNSSYPSILFVLNTRSGNSQVDYRIEIEKWALDKPFRISFFEIPVNCLPAQIRVEVDRLVAHRVVAIGGDGTIKLVAEALMSTKIPLGIIPAGSANGLARELKIPTEIRAALDVVIDGSIRKIHMVRVNGELCIHLSDIGLNAFMVKRFNSLDHRGMWAYMKAAWHVFGSRYRMQIEMQLNGEKVKLKAFMIVIANGTRYGTGAIINPIGTMDDLLFELVVIKKISLWEVFKTWISNGPYHPKMTAVYQTNSVEIRSGRNAHFQVDGEYMGKVNAIQADLIPHALEVMVAVAKPEQAQ